VCLNVGLAAATVAGSQIPAGLADSLAISPREWLLSGRAVSAVIVLARVRMIAVQWPSSPIHLGLPRLLG